MRPSGGLQRKRRDHARAGAWRAFDAKLATQTLGALTHADETEVCFRFLAVRHHEAGSSIGHFDTELVVNVGDGNGWGGVFGVTPGVIERFLHDAVERDL